MGWDAAEAHLAALAPELTIEDAAELPLAKPHVIALEAQPANVEGRPSDGPGSRSATLLKPHPKPVPSASTPWCWLKTSPLVSTSS